MVTWRHVESAHTAVTLNLENRHWVTLILVVILVLSVSSAESGTRQHYAIVDLGTLGGDTSFAYDLNASGAVAGKSENSDGNMRAFYWDQPHGMVDIAYGKSWAINDTGQVVGNYHQHNDYAFVWDLINGLQLLNRADYLFATAFDISCHGKVVGYARKFNDIDGTEAILWDAAADTIDVMETGYHPAYARNINGFGDVVGNHGNPSRAFIWNASGGTSDLGSVPLINGDYVAMGINDLGQVAGYVRTDSDEYRPFLWNTGLGMHLLSGEGAGLAYGINNNGDVVGAETYLIGLPGRAYLWKGGERIDLNDTLPQGSGWELREARAINDLGQICGTGLIDGKLHAFLMTPGPLRDGDTDDDGILDDVEDANQNGALDPGETDPLNADTDGDGVQDGTELGYGPDDVGADTDTDLFQPDLNPETTTDPLDPDTDGDGFQDGEEDLNHNGRVDEGEDDPTTPCQEDPVRIRGEPPVYFESIQACYDRAVTGDHIDIQGRTFEISLELDRPIRLSFYPGYGCSYTGFPIGATTIRGCVTVKRGVVNVHQGSLKLVP